MLQADPSLLAAVEGLQPLQEKHQFQMDILPVVYCLYCIAFTLSLSGAEAGCGDAGCGAVAAKPGDGPDGRGAPAGRGQTHRLPALLAGGRAGDHGRPRHRGSAADRGAHAGTGIAVE